MRKFFGGISRYFGSIKNVASLMKPYFYPYRFLITIAVLATIITASTNGALAYMVKEVFDKMLVEEKNIKVLYLIPIIVVVIYIAKSGFLFVQNYVMGYVGNKVIEKLRNETFDKMIHLSLRFYSDQSTGALMSRVTNDINLVQSSIPMIINMFRAVITMIGLLIVIFQMNWRLALIAIFVYPLFIVPLGIISRKLRKYSHRCQETMGEMTSVLQESFSGVRVVKAFVAEDKEYERFANTNAYTIKYANKSVLAGSLASPLTEAIGSFGIGAILFIGGYQIFNGTSTTGSFFGFLAALIQIYEPVKLFANSNNTLQAAISASQRVFGMLSEKNEILENNGSKECEAGGKDIEFVDVSFKYEDKYALNDVSFKVKSGSMVAFVGPSGAGKSTMANLIPRFYDVTEGKILIGGTDIREFDVYSLRHNIGIVSQEAFLFNDTIKNNIAYGCENVSMEDIVKASKASYSDEFIERLPEKYDTVCGERGVKLSGGQKQRITIARALLKNPSILILDEATSALDTESERVVQKALENLMEGRTSFVIAHRLSTILKADKIVVFNNGRIEAEGKHADILKTSPTYKRLYEMQFNIDNDNKSE